MIGVTDQQMISEWIVTGISLGAAIIWFIYHSKQSTAEGFAKSFGILGIGGFGVMAVMLAVNEIMYRIQ